MGILINIQLVRNDKSGLLYMRIYLHDACYNIGIFHILKYCNFSILVLLY